MTLERAILEACEFAAPRLLLPGVIEQHARDTVVPRPSVTEITETRDSLESSGHLVSVRDGASNKLRYGITDAGRAWLAANR